MRQISFCMESTKMRMYSLIKRPVGLIFENSHLRPVILPKRQYLHQYYPSSYVISHEDGTQFVWLNRKVVAVIHGKVYRESPSWPPQVAEKPARHLSRWNHDVNLISARRIHQSAQQFGRHAGGIGFSQFQSLDSFVGLNVLALRIHTYVEL